MSREPYAVLFLCTGNSARSILAESILTRSGHGRFRAFSAGSHPTGRVNPHALHLLERLGHSVGELRSKSWDEFTGEGAPSFDFVITVCDNAAGEVCPVWMGHPARAHWGIPDPAAATGSEAEIALAFAAAYRQLKTRIDLFTSLPLASLDAMSLGDRLDEIGKIEDAPAPVAIDPAHKDWPGFEAALRAAGLPTNDLDRPGQRFFRFAHGFGGYGLADGCALVRSVAVAPAERGQGFGAAMVGQLLEAARRDGAREAWLLTTSAADFFTRQGFVAVSRDQAPAAIAASAQFNGLCPASSVLMCRKPL